MFARSVLLLVFLIACKHTRSEPPPPRDSELAWYRVVLLGNDASEVAFLLGVPPENGSRAVLVSGTERVVAQVVHTDATLRVEFPLYMTALVLEAAAGGGYAGHYEISSHALGTGEMPLRATPVAAPTLALQATLSDGAPIDLGQAPTFWRMRLGDLGAKLVLDQHAPGQIDGTMFFDNGNVAYFGGSARGDRLLLAGFDGALPFSLDVRFDASRDHVEGMWRAGHLLSWHEPVRGDRTADFVVGSKIALDGPRAVLRHPLLRGYEGKPLIVELAATWCPTCKNVAPVLRELQHQHRSTGLEVVSLLYEFTAVPAENRAAEALFRATHHTTWTVKAVPGSQDDLVDTIPEGISNVDVGGFPVIVFRNRDGTIAGVHAGFPSASAAAPYQQAVAKFRRLTAEIVRSP